KKRKKIRRRRRRRRRRKTKRSASAIHLTRIAAAARRRSRRRRSTKRISLACYPVSRGCGRSSREGGGNSCHRDRMTDVDLNMPTKFQQRKGKEILPSDKLHLLISCPTLQAIFTYRHPHGARIQSLECIFSL